MRFPKQFFRYKTVVPPGEKALGSDTVPTGAPNQLTDDNALFAKFANINGWPCHRIAVAYKPPSGSLALTATLYLWDSLTESWYRTGPASVSLEANAITLFDVVGLLDGATVQSDLDAPTAGSIQAVLIVADPGGAPGGKHTFAMGPDLTTY